VYGEIEVGRQPLNDHVWRSDQSRHTPVRDWSVTTIARRQRNARIQLT